MPIELNGRLKKSMDASMLRFESDDMQDRLHIAMRPHTGHSTLVSDVLNLQYRVSGPLASLLSEDIMREYEAVSTFLWKLKAMEFSLQRAYLARSPCPLCARVCAAQCQNQISERLPESIMSSEEV